MPNLHIMVIEDDAATLEYIYELLTLHSYNVSRWMTSTVVLEQVTRRQPDLVMLDNRLGKHLCGWPILLSLHVMPETSHIPVLLYSGEHKMLQAHRDEIRSMGGDVLEKPFMQKQVLAKIEALTTAAHTTAQRCPLTDFPAPIVPLCGRHVWRQLDRLLTCGN